MKRLFLIAAVILSLSIALFGCSDSDASNSSFSGTINGEEAQIVFDEGTRSAGTLKAASGEYSFYYTDDGAFILTYPNGYILTQRTADGAVTQTWEHSETPEELGYLNGEDVESAVKYVSASSGSGKSSILSVLILALGLLYTALPHKMWRIARGWMFKNAEPSKMNITVYRIFGGILIIIALILFFI